MFSEKLNEVLAFRKPFISDRINLISVSLSAIIHIIHWLTIYFKLRPTMDEVLLLRFSVIYGADFLGRGAYIYFIPAAALLLLFINIGLSMYLFNKEKLASYFTSVFGLVVQIMFLAASLILISINV